MVTWIGKSSTMDKRGPEHRIPAHDFFVSRKTDGEFTVIIFDDGEAMSVNRGGTVRVGLPYLADVMRVETPTFFAR